MGIAQDQLSYTVLFADAPGVVTATGAEPGEVVRAGQMIVNVARQGGRDAVFDVSEQLIRTGPRDPVVQIALTNDPSVRATGRVREVSPQADPATRTFQVKVGIIDPPPAMELGSTVTGSIKLSAPAGLEVPPSALTEADGRPAVWVVDPQEPDRVAAQRGCLAIRSGGRRRFAGAGHRRDRRHRGRADAASGPEGPPAGRRPVMRFNLSEWALRHRSLVTYFMLVIAVAGIWSYLRLGRSEDPDFTVKTMVVQASWPGATLGDTLEQITDRIESKLQETPNLDYLKSYTSAGQTTIFVNLKDSTPPGAGAGHLVSGAQEGRRHPQHAAARHRRPRLQRRVRRYLRHRLRLHRGRLHGPRAAGLRRRCPQAASAASGHLQDRHPRRAGRARLRRILGRSNWRASGSTAPRSIAALQAQNAVTPAGIVQTGNEKILVRVSGAFRSEQDVLAVNFVAKNGRIIRLGDIAHVTRGPADPAQPMFRVNGRQGIGLAIAMRKGGDVLALGRNVEHAMAEITANLPVGIEPTLVADQPVTVEHAVDDFMEALWEAVAIVLGVSLVSLGLRAGAVVALSIPLVLAAVFVAMSFCRHRSSADFARRPHHRARPAGR